MMLTKLLFTFCFIFFTNILCFGQDNFDKLANDFNNKAVTSLGSESMETSDSLSVYVSKKTVKNAIETTLNSTQLSVNANFKNKIKEPEPEVKIKWTVECSEGEGCGSCDMGCSKFNVLCKGREAACEAKRKVCLVKREGEKLFCEGKKFIASKLNEKKIGEIHVQDFFVKGSVNTTPFSISLADDLERGSLNANNVSAQVKIEGKVAFHVEPEVAALAVVIIPGAINCLPVQPPIKIPSDTEVLNIKLKPPVIFETKFEKSITESPDGMNLNISVRKADVEIEANIVEALARIVNTNKTTYITCIALSLPITVLGAVNDFIPIPISIEQSIQADIMSFDVGNIKINVPGRKNPFILIPKTNQLSLGVTEKK